MACKVLIPAAAIFAVSLTTVALSAGQQAPHSHGAATSTPRAAAAQKPAPPGPLPPLPAVGYEPVLPMPLVRQVYEFAARHPEVLQYVPCYCGCERIGHTANHDCFVKSRAASGRITEWDAHGIGCAICLDVGRKAMAMFNSGMPVAAIRTAIEKEYGSRFPTHTPTPLPPTARKG